MKRIFKAIWEKIKYSKMWGTFGSQETLIRRYAHEYRENYSVSVFDFPEMKTAVPFVFSVQCNYEKNRYYICLDHVPIAVIFLSIASKFKVGDDLIAREIYIRVAKCFFPSKDLRWYCNLSEHLVYDLAERKDLDRITLNVFLKNVQGSFSNCHVTKNALLSMSSELNRFEKEIGKYVN